MKKKTAALVVAILLSLAFLPQFISYAAKLLQQPEVGWVVWETSVPVQRVAWDDSILWAGHYKGGLSQWSPEAGQSANYTTGDGLTGNHVMSIAVDGSGQKWLALQDGSLNLTLDGASFSDLTPAGIAGVNAWDVSLNGGEVWLASLGGGVSRYSGGSWTTYNKANSNLPYDDIYAVAANGGSPWVGTIGYGVANLQGGTWVSYTLPVQIPDPLNAGVFMSNQAVTDIAVDSAGNKWFATDGSGVVVLDASNSNWTVYDSSNSGLPSNFIQRIYIDPQGNYWFGTLGGGVARLSSNFANWQVFNTSNSSLPEDDVLDVAMDDAGGLWLAAYDTGLAYYGLLPSPAPEFDLDLAGQPNYIPGQVKGYYLWVNPDTFEWTLAWSGDGRSHMFEGEISFDSPVTIIEQIGLEEGDSVSTSGNSLLINAGEQYGEDSVTFKPDLAATELTIRLKIDGAYYPYNIHIGSSASTPGTAPFRLPALQPQAPVVTVGGDITITEGEYLVLSADVADPDSPLGHTYIWDFGDTTAPVNTLFADHIYKDEGAYTAQLTVTDVHGLSATASLTVTVENVPPTADFYFYPFELNTGEEVSFTGYFYDPGELDTHTITWDFGDGSTPVTGLLETTHTYLQAGAYEVTFTVADDDGGATTANSTITIVQPSIYTLTVNIIGQGSVTRSDDGPYQLNDVVVLTATADPGWTFTGWSECAGTDPCSVTMSGDKTVIATFTQDEYTLDVVSENGTVTKTPEQATYHYGDVVQLEAIPNTGWEFTGWSGGASGIENPVSLTILGNTSITASYGETNPPYVYTLVLQPNGADGVDAQLLSSSATTNYGSTSTMGIGESNNASNRIARSLVKFDLSSLPADADIVSATLSLWTSSDLSNVDSTYNVYRLKTPFNEGQTTWNLSASGINWQSPGASGENDREGTPIGSVQILNNDPLNTEKQIVLETASIQEFVDGTFTNNGFILAAETELDDRFDFKTSDNSNSSQRPMLVLQYTSPSTTPPPPGYLFGDGFESGDFSAWDWAETDGGDLSVITGAAAIGTYGMQAVINDTNTIKVYDYSPAGEKHYSVRFYLDPNSVSIPTGSLYVLTGTSINWAFCLYLEQLGTDYRLTTCGREDNSDWYDGKPVYIQDQWQSIEMEWKAASAVGANDGYLRLYVNDILMDEVANLDTDTLGINEVTLGVGDIPTGTSGAIYFDGFESRTGNFIGADPNGPQLPVPLTDLIFRDGFESADLTAWDSVNTGGGNLSVTSSAAAIGGYGLQATANGTTSMQVTDYSPLGEKQYHTRFYFNPSNFNLTPEDRVGIFSAYGGNTAFRLFLRYSGGTYWIQQDYQMDNLTYVGGVYRPLTAGWQALEFDWRAASAPGANDGSLSMSINNSLVETLSGIDNDTYTVETVQMGLVASVDAGMSGSLYFDGFVSQSAGPIGLDPNGPTLSGPIAPPDLAFSDDFESGDLSKWSGAVTNSGNLAVSTEAADQGLYGLKVNISGTSSMYARYYPPILEDEYHARFRFHPNSLNLANGKAHYLYEGSTTSTGARLIRLEILSENSEYKLRVQVRRDDDTYINSAAYTISNDWHTIQVGWKAASADGSNDGMAELWIDDVLMESLTGVDNDLILLNEIRLGAPSGLDTGTSGAMLFDEFTAHRSVPLITSASTFDVTETTFVTILQSSVQFQLHL